MKKRIKKGETVTVNSPAYEPDNGYDKWVSFAIMNGRMILLKDLSTLSESDKELLAQCTVLPTCKRKNK